MSNFLDIFQHQESKSYFILSILPILLLLFSCDAPEIRKECISGDCHNGEGRIVWYTMKYEGAFQLGKMHGQGRMGWADGRQYDGDWVDGYQEGQGSMRWPEGKYYEGLWLQGLPHGEGMLRFRDGRVIRGRFERGYYKGD